MTKLERNEMLNKQKKEREFWDDIVKPNGGYIEQTIIFGSIEQLEQWKKVVTDFYELKLPQ